MLKLSARGIGDRARRGPNDPGATRVHCPPIAPTTNRARAHARQVREMPRAVAHVGKDRATLTFCAEPGCGALVERGRCAIHARSIDRARGSRQSRGYGNRWARRSAQFRARYPLCGMRPHGIRPVMSQCFDEGRTTIATQTDHVVPHNGNDALFWNEIGNWQSLCLACHMRKTAAGL